MSIPSHQTAPRDNAKVAAFNYNKLQAVACMAASAVVSIALIVWAIKSLL